MPYSQRDTSVTKDEVYAIVNGKSVFTTKNYQDPTKPGVQRINALTKADVADYIATARGMDARRAQFESRTSLLRQWVSLGQVEKHLETLVADKHIVAVTGEHWCLNQVSGTMKRATYYLSLHAVDVAVEDSVTKQRAAVSANAAKWATKVLQDRHEEEYRELRVQYVFEHPTPTVDEVRERF